MAENELTRAFEREGAPAAILGPSAALWFVVGALFIVEGLWGSSGEIPRLSLPVAGNAFATLVLPDAFGTAAQVEAALPRLALLPPGTAEIQSWYVGLLPLFLGLAGLLGRKPSADIRSAGLVFVLIGLIANLLPEAAQWIVRGWNPRGMVAFGLLWSAITGMWVCAGTTASGDDRVRPRGLAAVAALGLLTTLAIAALSAGAGTPPSVLAGLLDRLPEAERAAYLASPELLAASAEHVRGVLDRAAVTAFMSTVTLLWFLKRRDGLSAWGVVIIATADLIWHHLGAPGLG